VAVVLASFWESLARGLVVAETDTRVFFYPLMSWFAEELKAGRFPLWNPYIFAGYPMFADGEIGLAYPLHLLLISLLPANQAFIWLRVSSVLIAAVSAYALCRALRLGTLAALLGGLTFSLASFFPTQQHHENVTRTAAWLPLVLACVEWALHRAGWRRHALLTAAGVALAMAALGLHPQVLAISLLGFALYVPVRVLTGPVGARSSATSMEDYPPPQPSPSRGEGAVQPSPASGEGADQPAAARGEGAAVLPSPARAEGVAPPSAARAEGVVPPPPAREEGRASLPSPLTGEGEGGGETHASRLRSRLPAAARDVLTRGALVVWVGGYVGCLGLGLAAIQLAPLAELGAATYRGAYPDYFFATSYALPIHNLLTLVFPYFFRGPDATYWSLWAKWETTLYVGVAPLLLGFLGLVLSRRREILGFLALAVVGLWLAFATYAPFDLYGALWQLPGFSAFRVPGRYSYLFILGWAILAAFGLQALHDVSQTRRLTRRLVAAAAIALFALGAIGLAWAMDSLRTTLLADPSGALASIRDSYLSIRHHPEGLTESQVYRGLVHSLSLDTPRTAFGLGVLSAVLAVLLGATLLRHTAGFWRGVLVLIGGLDLVIFGTSLHYRVPIDQLSQRTPAINFLTEEAGRGKAPSGASSSLASVEATPAEWRLMTLGSVPSLEFDRLAPFGLEDIGGYSSAQPRRNYDYWATISSVQNRLVDLANVRFLAYPRQQASLPSYRRVPFDPERPLMLGGKDAAGGREVYSLGGVAAHRVQVVAALTRAADIPQGDVVAQVRVTDRTGVTALIPLRAGSDVAEWAYDRTDLRGRVKHGQPTEIAFRRPDVFLVDGSAYFLYLYYSEHDLPAAMNVQQIEVRYVHPRGAIELYGLGLYNFETGETAGISQQMRSKLRVAYSDRDIVMMENMDVFPRAYVVPGARSAAAGQTPIFAMQNSPFDPSREVMLENGVGMEAGGWGMENSAYPNPIPQPLTPKPAEALVVGTDRVVYRASSPGGGYFVQVANFFPGWRALVDGQEAPLLLANGLFRAVPLTAGEHLVELRYEPASLELGRLVSLLAAAFGLATLAGALGATGLRRSR
jgi:hypothetical protein